MLFREELGSRCYLNYGNNEATAIPITSGSRVVYTLFKSKYLFNRYNCSGPFWLFKRATKFIQGKIGIRNIVLF